jgi:hypothetical protein
VTVAWAVVETLEFGGLSRKGGRIAVTDFAGLPTGGASPIDLLVGADLLHHVALDIDYDEGRFRLLPSGRMPFGGISVPLSLARDSGIYLSELTIGARRVRPVIVDTGDGSSATVTSTSWNAARPEGARVTTTLSYGLGGQVVADLTILPQLRIGALPVRNVELRIERDAGFAQATGTAGRIGSGLLERYRVLMDPRAGRMILQPGKRIDARPVKSTSGILAGFQSGELAVLHIMRGSPAAAAGWQVGERICRIDGQPLPADYLASPLAGWAIGAPGRTVTLELCGGDKRQLTLADFY